MPTQAMALDEFVQLIGKCADAMMFSLPGDGDKRAVASLFNNFSRFKVPQITCIQQRE